MVSLPSIACRDRYVRHCRTLKPPEVGRLRAAQDGEPHTDTPEKFINWMKTETANSGKVIAIPTSNSTETVTIASPEGEYKKLI
jgi:hypothetical protein